MIWVLHLDRCYHLLISFSNFPSKSSDQRKFRLSIYRNTVLYWRGFVEADLYSESFTSPPYEVSIKAVDGFNLLSNVQLLDTDFTQLSGSLEA